MTITYSRKDNGNNQAVSSDPSGSGNGVDGLSDKARGKRPEKGPDDMDIDSEEEL